MVLSVVAIVLGSYVIAESIAVLNAMDKGSSNFCRAKYVLAGTAGLWKVIDGLVDVETFAGVFYVLIIAMFVYYDAQKRVSVLRRLHLIRDES